MGPCVCGRVRGLSKQECRAGIGPVGTCESIGSYSFVGNGADMGCEGEMRCGARDKGCG